MEMKKLFIAILVFTNSFAFAQTTCECVGNGTETLVFEAGMGGWSIMYKPLTIYLEKEYRICLINRDGYSDYSKSQTRDSKTIAREIYDALDKQGIKDSIVIIGHSFGGLNVRMFQHMYPEMAKGIILLDASHPDQFDRLPEEFKSLKEKQPEQMLKVEKIAKKGYLKYSKKSIPTFGIPQEYLDEYYSVTMQAFYYNTYYNEIMHFDSSLKQIATIKGPIKAPLLVLSAKNSMDNESMPGKNKKYPFEEHNSTWLQLQKEQTQISVNSEWKVMEGNHYFFLTKPEETAQIIKDFLKEQFE